MSLGKAVVKLTDMDEEMKMFAVQQADYVLGQNLASEKLVAKFMKEYCEKRYKGVWHCITGRNFGGFVTHETGKYIYFYVGQRGFLLWSTPSA